jgi:hypothetical protein
MLDLLDGTGLSPELVAALVEANTPNVAGTNFASPSPLVQALAGHDELLSMSCSNSTKECDDGLLAPLSSLDEYDAFDSSHEETLTPDGRADSRIMNLMYGSDRDCKCLAKLNPKGWSDIERLDPDSSSSPKTSSAVRISGEGGGALRTVILWSWNLLRANIDMASWSWCWATGSPMDTCAEDMIRGRRPTPIQMYIRHDDDPNRNFSTIGTSGRIYGNSDMAVYYTSTNLTNVTTIIEAYRRATDSGNPLSASTGNDLLFLQGSLSCGLTYVAGSILH